MKLKFLTPSFSLRIYSLFYIEKIQIKIKLMLDLSGITKEKRYGIFL